jgi:hypothetical protein
MAPDYFIWTGKLHFPQIPAPSHNFPAATRNFPAGRSREFRLKPPANPALLCGSLADRGAKLRNFPVFSRKAGNSLEFLGISNGERFARDCILRQPVQFRWLVRRTRPKLSTFHRSSRQQNEMPELSREPETPIFKGLDGSNPPLSASQSSRCGILRSAVRNGPHLRHLLSHRPSSLRLGTAWFRFAIASAKRRGEPVADVADIENEHRRPDGWSNRSIRGRPLASVSSS